MRTIYLLLTKTDTVLSRAIARVTGDPYTHVAISLDKELNELYSFGRKTKSNPFNSGFVREQIIGSIYEENLKCDCAIYETVITDRQYNRLKLELTKMSVDASMYKYNFLGLFNFIFNTNVKRKYKYFCSEFVSEMLRRIDTLPDRYAPEKTKPSDFIDMDIFNKVYSGQLGSLVA